MRSCPFSDGYKQIRHDIDVYIHMGAIRLEPISSSFKPSWKIHSKAFLDECLPPESLRCTSNILFSSKLHLHDAFHWHQCIVVAPHYSDLAAPSVW